MIWRLLIDGLLVLAWLRVLITVGARPAGRWRTGRIGKYLSMLVAAVAVAVVGHFILPWGAAIVWWRVVVRQYDPFELPMADGRRMPDS